MKLSRQEAIKQIIKTQVIETQSDLAEALKKAGFNVTQATVSRDIKDMVLIKVDGISIVFLRNITKSLRQTVWKICFAVIS